MTPEKKKEAIEDLRRLKEIDYGGGMNLCYGDGHYARSLMQKWRMSIEELSEKCGYYKKAKRVEEIKQKIEGVWND